MKIEKYSLSRLKVYGDFKVLQGPLLSKNYIFPFCGDEIWYLRLMKNLLLALVILCLSPLATAQVFDAYLRGLQADLLFDKTDVGRVLERRVSVIRFNALNRAINPDAEATYHPIFKQINLHDDLLMPNSRPTSIRDARLIRGPQFQYVPLATIFHEMGHAELDTIIEKGDRLIDHVMRDTYSRFLRSFYRETFGVLRPYTIFHEHFAYYRSDLIDFLYGEVMDIFFLNGYNVHRNGCFLSRPLRAMLEAGVELEEFKKWHSFTPKENDAFYRTRVSPRYIFVRSNSYDLHEGQDYQRVLNHAHSVFWAYHQEVYGFPINRADFVKRMNESQSYRQRLSCREQLYNDFQESY
jgi:hypothetical protein